mmetsp:Transcript_101528/g.293849  ORF Transcript_101528/g.293849 Transcript_101528/m.293849 type:complete len:345 (+) Transcript_101528:346-1380(+)
MERPPLAEQALRLQAHRHTQLGGEGQVRAHSDHAGEQLAQVHALQASPRIVAEGRGGGPPGCPRRGTDERQPCGALELGADHFELGNAWRQPCRPHTRLPSLFPDLVLHHVAELQCVPRFEACLDSLGHKVAEGRVQIERLSQRNGQPGNASLPCGVSRVRDETVVTRLEAALLRWGWTIGSVLARLLCAKAAPVVVEPSGGTVVRLPIAAADVAEVRSARPADHMVATAVPRYLRRALWATLRVRRKPGGVRIGVPLAPLRHLLPPAAQLLAIRGLMTADLVALRAEAHPAAALHHRASGAPMPADAGLRGHRVAAAGPWTPRHALRGPDKGLRPECPEPRQH